jgi:hypothetical protein
MPIDSLNIVLYTKLGGVIYNGKAKITSPKTKTLYFEFEPGFDVLYENPS